MPARLQVQLDFMRRRPEVVLAGTQIAFMAESRLFKRSQFPTAHSDILRSLVRKAPVVCQPSCMIRADAARKTGGYRLPRGEDFDLFLRLSEVGLLANLEHRLHTYRIHLGSTFATQYPEHRAHIAYAISAYRSRVKGAVEPSLTEFLAAWDNCGPFRRLLRRLDTWSAREFRHALLELGRGSRFKGVLHMVAAVGCRPGTAARQVSSRLIRALTTQSVQSSIRFEESLESSFPRSEA
jgi:hypothetical protein